MNILIFNKITGVYVGMTSGALDGEKVDAAQLDPTYFDYKTVDFDSNR